MTHKVKAENEIEINTPTSSPRPQILLFCQEHLQILVYAKRSFLGDGGGGGGGGGGNRGYSGALENRERFSARYRKPKKILNKFLKNPLNVTSSLTI